MPAKSKAGLPNRDFSSESTTLNPLYYLTDGQGTWRVFRVSALYDLQYNLTRLKQYATKIKKALSCTIVEKAPVKYRVGFEVWPELKRNPDDAHALSITVYTTKLTERGEESLAYSLVLISWGQASAVPRATHLPLMLERGRGQIAGAMKCILAKMFDCCITPFSFLKSHMLLFSINFCQLETFDASKGLSFYFKVPQTTTNCKISVTISLRDFMDICERVAAEEEAPLSRQQLMELSYVSLQRHIFLTARIDISVLELVEVSHPKGQVKMNGSVRMKTIDSASSMLDVLNEMLK